MEGNSVLTASRVDREREVKKGVGLRRRGLRERRKSKTREILHAGAGLGGSRKILDEKFGQSLMGVYAGGEAMKKGKGIQVHKGKGLTMGQIT